MKEIQVPRRSSIVCWKEYDRVTFIVKWSQRGNESGAWIAFFPLISQCDGDVGSQTTESQVWKLCSLLLILSQMPYSHELLNDRHILRYALIGLHTHRRYLPKLRWYDVTRWCNFLWPQLSLTEAPAAYDFSYKSLGYLRVWADSISL